MVVTCTGVLGLWLALAAGVTPEKPAQVFLEMERIQEKAAQGATTTRILEIRLVVQAGSAPVEVHTLEGVMPRVRGSDGKEVVLGDWRAVAGYAPPQIPPAPEAPLAPGKRHVVCRYTVVRRTDGGYNLLGPYGGADLAAGSYVMTAELDLTPTTREMWMAQFRAGLNSPTRQPGGPAPGADPEKEAQKHAAHWKAVPGFFKGHMQTPELSFTLR